MSTPFDLDAAVADKTGEPFAFTWGGEPFAVVPLAARDLEEQLLIIDEAERLEEVRANPKAVLDLMTRIAGVDLLTEMRKARPVGGVALTVLIREWMAHESVGKESDSSASSAATAKPSKVTSRSGRARRTS